MHRLRLRYNEGAVRKVITKKYKTKNQRTMKKLIYLSLLSLPLFMTACGNKTQGTTEADSAIVDSDSVVAVEAESPNVVKGELGLFELQGPVKSCTLKNKWGKTTRTFDEQGMWLTHDGKPLAKVYPNGIERDEQGRILKGKMDANGNGDDYEYNADGKRKRYFFHYDGETTEELNSYDTEGKLVSVKKTIVSFDTDGEPITETYEILATDEHGNWTKRKVIEGKVVEDTQTRTIEYYK